MKNMKEKKQSFWKVTKGNRITKIVASTISGFGLIGSLVQLPNLVEINTYPLTFWSQLVGIIITVVVVWYVIYLIGKGVSLIFKKK